MTGKLFFIFTLALLLAGLGAWALAVRYRHAMRRLMSAPTATATALALGTVAVASAGHRPAPPRPVSIADNRHEGRRIAALLVVLSMLMAASSASLWLVVAFPGEPFAPKRAAVLALMQVWPVLPALGLLWHWRLPRVFAALGVWFLLFFAVGLWRSIEPRPLELLAGTAALVGLPLALVTVLCWGQATRAVAPWLLPLFVLLVWASVAGLDALGVLVEQRSPLVMWLARGLGAHAAMALFAVLPWLVAWWPAQRLGRALGAAYAAKQLSELLVLFTAVWAIALLMQALQVAGSAGAGAALLQFAPLAWVPLGVAVWRRRAEAGRPPTLLVLRVFQRDAAVQRLFDDVVERWRVSGNTVLIAGTDLADRTLDADDIYTFLDGGLADRFIRTPAEVAPRLAAFDLARDACGRFRVNECYCHDTAWREALAALVEMSDVVLMDLRGFHVKNEGCRHELGVLARSPRRLRVVVLFDAATDRGAAAAAIGEGGAAAAAIGEGGDAAAAIGEGSADPNADTRFAWVEVPRIDATSRRAVFARLFEAEPLRGVAPRAAPQPIVPKN